MKDDKGLVLVTGASGFIAQHIIIALHRAGRRVRGTVRDLARTAEAVAALDRTEAGSGSSLEWVETDLDSDAGWDIAVRGVDAVMHVASPIPIAQPKDREAFVATARDGALRVLHAAASSGTVRKVVMTSSVAAVGDGLVQMPGHVFTEADWSDPEGPKISPYARSKTIAERAAWDFMKRESPDFSLTTILPGLVFGPVLGKDYGVSPEVVRRLLAGEVPGTPRLGWSIVDVRDVAELHLLALVHSNTDGERLIATNDFLWMSDMASALREACPDRADKLPRREIPGFVLRLLGMFDPAIRGLIPDLGRCSDYSHAKAADLVGWKPRSGREATQATGRSLIEHGVV
jgi:dihydroflavonol-4-reductase